ncbi:MAG: Lrp/AsnC family transcriptional regulator [Halocynthiibacter sp.]
MNMDEIDKKLLQALQENALATAQELSEKLHLSASQIGRRRQRLEASGLIKSYTARLSSEALGLGVQAFVEVQMATHDQADARAFAQMVAARREIVSVWTLTGESDYLMRVYCESLRELHHLIDGALLPHPAVARVQSQIVMDQLKQDAPLPI